MAAMTPMGLIWFPIVLVSMLVYAAGLIFFPNKSWVRKGMIGWVVLALCLITGTAVVAFLYQTGREGLLKGASLSSNSIRLYVFLIVNFVMIRWIPWRSVKLLLIVSLFLYSYVRGSSEWRMLRSSFLDHKGVWGYICPSVLGPFEDGVIPERFSRYYSQEEPLYGFWYEYYELEREQRRDQICAEFKKEVETEK